MTANEGQPYSAASGSLNSSSIAQQADAALNTLGDKVSNLTGQHETVNKFVAGVQENVLGTQREQSNENQKQNQNESTSVSKEDVSTEQVEEFLRYQYQSYKK